MESIILVTEGVNPSDKHVCFFCEKEAHFTFGVIDGKRIITTTYGDKPANGHVMSSVALCDTHAEAFNSLLSGEHDVNELITVMKTSKTKKLNLRRR